jgi:hypothetical protein
MERALCFECGDSGGIAQPSRQGWPQIRLSITILIGSIPNNVAANLRHAPHWRIFALMQGFGEADWKDSVDSGIDLR